MNINSFRTVVVWIVSLFVLFSADILLAEVCPEKVMRDVQARFRYVRMHEEGVLDWDGNKLNPLYNFSWPDRIVGGIPEDTSYMPPDSWYGNLSNNPELGVLLVQKIYEALFGTDITRLDSRMLGHTPVFLNDVFRMVNVGNIDSMKVWSGFYPIQNAQWIYEITTGNWFAKLQEMDEYVELLINLETHVSRVDIEGKCTAVVWAPSEGEAKSAVASLHDGTNWGQVRYYAVWDGHAEELGSGEHGVGFLGRTARVSMYDSMMDANGNVIYTDISADLTNNRFKVRADLTGYIPPGDATIFIKQIRPEVNPYSTLEEVAEFDTSAPGDENNWLMIANGDNVIGSVITTGYVMRTEDANPWPTQSLHSPIQYRINGWKTEQQCCILRPVWRIDPE